ncbi:GNAT family N-acetyltransferase [Paenibacillus lemnae]|uniref:N-acetyltransferase domain-containing protein n=1 Tax=Paenibacillus lemnae TaxID=1330551 RepID=A0A848M3N1_PAELE|nr:GNAT family N-acetyltransferase [Paenibacillus lemnae]NMO95557.1 hypothetical protein [Paenibacillus lemnae]
MKATVRRCHLDADYASFSRFYLHNCREFDHHYMLQDALVHLIHTVTDAQILLFHDTEDQLVAFIQYRFDEDQDYVFIDAAMLAKNYRGSRIFFEGLRDLAKIIAEDHPGVHTVVFHASADNLYINRIYSKFAQRIEVRERNGRIEHVYKVSLKDLMTYVRLDRA